MNKIIQNLFFITLFINLTIPKAGIYLRKGEDIRIPLSLGYIIFLFLFLIWAISNRKDLRDIFLGSFIKRVAMSYLIYVFLRYLFIDSGNYRYIGRVIVHFIIYGGYILAFYFGLEVARNKKIIPMAIKIIVISLGLISLYGLAQVFFDSEQIAIVGLTETYGSPLKPLITYMDGEGVLIQEGSTSLKNTVVTTDSSGKIVSAGRKVFSTFHHGNLFGGQLVLFTPIIFSLLCISRRRKQKIIYFCLGIIIFLSILFANSRGAFIGFFISCLTLWLISPAKRRVFLLSVLVLLSGIAFFNLILDVAQRRNLQIASADVVLYRKAFVGRYETAFEIPWLIKKKLIPVDKDRMDIKLDGITNYRYQEFKKFCKEVFDKKNIRYLILGRGYTGMNVYQNLYFNLLYNLGIVGLSLFLYIIVYILWKAFKVRAIFAPIEARVLAVGGISGIVGFLVENLFDNLFYFTPFGLNFWMLSSLVLVAASYKERP